MARSALRSLSTILVFSGALLLLDVALTIAWQEPVSALYGRIAQERLEGELRDAGRLSLRPAERRLLQRLEREPERLRYLARRARRRAGQGEPLGRIVATRAKIDFVMVHGTDGASLRKGPGHFPDTSLPGEAGTVAVAGHRTTYQAPFRHVDALRPDDPIRLEMPYGTFTYRVERTRIVRPDAVWVTRRVGYERLVLTACHPLYSAEKRIVVFARLVRATPTARILTARSPGDGWPLAFARTAQRSSRTSGSRPRRERHLASSPPPRRSGRRWRRAATRRPGHVRAPMVSRPWRSRRLRSSYVSTSISPSARRRSSRSCGGSSRGSRRSSSRRASVASAQAMTTTRTSQKMVMKTHQSPSMCVPSNTCTSQVRCSVELEDQHRAAGGFTHPWFSASSGRSSHPPGPLPAREADRHRGAFAGASSPSTWS